MAQEPPWRTNTLDGNDARRWPFQNAPNAPYGTNQTLATATSVWELDGWDPSSQRYTLNPAAANFHAQPSHPQSHPPPRTFAPSNYQPTNQRDSWPRHAVQPYPAQGSYSVPNIAPRQVQQHQWYRPEPPPQLPTNQRPLNPGFELTTLPYGGRPPEASSRKDDTPSPVSLSLSLPSSEFMSNRQPYTIPLLVREGFVYKQRDYFTVGKVFEADVVELSDDISVTTASGAAASSIYMKPRFYVVIEHRMDHFTALGLYSYSKCGVAKRGIKSEHCIVYSNDKAGPFIPLPQERPRLGEEGMKPVAIRVERADQESVHLRDATRLNLGREFSPLDYTRLPVKHYGKVDRRFIAALIHQWGAVREARVERARESVKRDQARKDAKSQRAKASQ